MELVYARNVIGRRVYLDNNATTPPSREVLDALQNIAATTWGNPSSTYSEGVAARKALDYAREDYANVLKVKPESIYFTSCGTESNNIALRAVMRRAMAEGRDVLLTSSVEHPSVKRTAATIGCRHILLPIDSKGYVLPATLDAALSKYGKKVGMISVIMAQNEFGTIQRIAQLSAISTEYARRTGIAHIPFHSDATQMFGKYPGIEPDKFGIDMMTASGHKYHGPRGFGLLYAKSGLLDNNVTPMTGGGQERGCRSGTENVPTIFAAATALLQAIGDQNEWLKSMEKVKYYRDGILRTLVKNIPGLIINGDVEKGLYNTLNVSLPGIRGHSLVEYLDKEHIAISSGSACSKGKPSESLMALYGGGKDAETIAHSAIRISLSKYNTASECEYAANCIVKGWHSVKQ